MIISSRLSKILLIMLESDDFISADKLAEKLQISKRTIFRELSDIDYYLNAYELSLNNKQRKGYCLEGAIENKERLSEDLKTQKVDYLNKEERQNLLIFEILQENEVRKLYYYANLFQVSESTISNDLDSIEAWFTQYDLKIIRTPGLGVKLEGSESNYRKALREIISKSIQENQKNKNIKYDDEVHLLQQLFLQDKDGIMKLLNQEILTRVLNVFNEHHHELDLDRFAQSSYMGLIIHLTIAIDRILKKEAINDNEEIIMMMKDSYSYEQAEKMKQYLEDEFAIQIPEVEIAFISMHIQGAKLNKIEEEIKALNVLEEEEMQQLIDEMIKEFDTCLLHDEQLRHGLIVHLKPALVRMQNGMSIYNPLLIQIKQDYPKFYEKAQDACMYLATKYNISVPEDEIGYIAMHFGAAKERSERETYIVRSINVGIVCSSGIGVSALMQARIKKFVDDEVHLKTLGIEAVKANTHDCEMLISTFEFDENIDKLIVNPLLPKEDVKRIKDEIEHIRKLNKNNQKVQVIIDTNVDELVNEMCSILEHISLVTCEHHLNKDELLKKGAESFTKGNVQELYEKLKAREQMASTVYKPLHFALFHAQVDSIQSAQVKVLRANEQSFISDELDGVKFALVIFVNEDASEQSKMMISSISSAIIEDDSFYETLCTGSIKEIYACIESILKDYLFTTLVESRGIHNEEI